MERKVNNNYYRLDIDGIRSIAVLAVVFFHLGFLPNGYLGVDVFFVISGYLITKIIYSETLENKFSIVQFYIRRIRRIIPLVLFINLIALIVGIFVMLPDDLENLNQSIFATNLFSNNILQFITTRNYWDLVNEYKPLMHTWSLGIEEQFYLIYPLIFIFLGFKRIKWVLPVLYLFTLLSIIMFVTCSDDAMKFYLIQYRFFELSFGGLGAILFRNNSLNGKYKFIFIIILILLLTVNLAIPSNLKLVLVVLSTLALLVSDSNSDRFSEFCLENKLVVGIGKISFSLYMWHQLIFAYTRYTVINNFNFGYSILLLFITVVLSIMSYVFVEQVFRDKSKVSTKKLLITSIVVFIFVQSCALFIYSRSGVISDVPELGISKSFTIRKMNSLYNDRIYNLNTKFTNNKKIKIFIIGNSFARDWANILLESKFGESIEISYSDDIYKCTDTQEKLNKARYIYFSEISKSDYFTFSKNFNIDFSKVKVIGTKNFGLNNGIFYNRKGSTNYFKQRTILANGFLEKNEILKSQWGNKYIDLLELVIDKNNTVPVFTPDCKFISQDCRHLTTFGAKYFALLLENKLSIH
jgi:peptidoglycan/LPS O-acetylase OafA/YrhL